MNKPAPKGKGVSNPVKGPTAAPTTGKKPAQPKNTTPPHAKGPAKNKM